MVLLFKPNRKITFNLNLVARMLFSNLWRTTLDTRVWGAVRKNIISDRFSTKTAISAHI